jgi:tryptophan-rich hypothetical protein
MNKISSKKLINSKWTKVRPLNREKHFLVTQVNFDEFSNVKCCLIEAVITKKEEEINWNELKDSSIWLQGWK